MSRGMPLLLAALAALVSCGERPILTAEDQEVRVLERRQPLTPELLLQRGRDREGYRADYKLIRAFEAPKTQQMMVEWGWRVLDSEDDEYQAGRGLAFKFGKDRRCPKWGIVLKDADGFEVAREQALGWQPQQGTGFLSLENARRIASGTINQEMGKYYCR